MTEKKSKSGSGWPGAIIFLFLLSGIFAGTFALNILPDKYQDYGNRLLTAITTGKAPPVPEQYVTVQDFSVETDTTATNQTGTSPTPGATPPAVSGAPANPFAAIDQHAFNAPAGAATDVATLAAYLSQPAQTDLQKTRAIYSWLASHISYNDAGYNSGNYGDVSPEGVLASGKAVCSGFGSLFKALGDTMGLEVLEISGYAKGFGYTPGQKFTKTDHAWNAVKINGKWRLFDATWGRGYGENVNGQLVSHNEFDEFWFDTDPYAFVFSHFPEDESLQFTDDPMTLQAYEDFPYVGQYFFKLGFDSKDLYRRIRKGEVAEVAETFSFDTYVQVKNAPVSKALQVGESYDFEFFVPAGTGVALIDADSGFSHFQENNHVFTHTFTPAKPGELKISVQHPKGGKSYWVVLQYTVAAGV